MNVWLLFSPQISQEEALLAVAVLPAIRELDICRNPLITQRISNCCTPLLLLLTREFCNFPYVSSRRTPLADPVPPAQTGNHSQGQLGASHKSVAWIWWFKPKGRPSPPHVTQSLSFLEIAFFFPLPCFSVEGCVWSSSGWSKWCIRQEKTRIKDQ